MDTVRGLMALLKADQVTLDEVTESLRAISSASRPLVPTIAQSYRRAEEVPGDNDKFWIDVAYRQHVIKYHDYKQLVHALAEDPGRAVAGGPAPAGSTRGSWSGRLRPAARRAAESRRRA
ncbi:hypothetical protein [Mycobacterium sp. M23085]|uniref:hypothetical protein n=1 Tax=Mycobacterium sp. M23085 TaxID=3378087 RepID=UPI003877D0DA